MHLTSTHSMRWALSTDPLRVRRLRLRFALSEPTARAIAGLAYPEARQ